MTTEDIMREREESIKEMLSRLEIPIDEIKKRYLNEVGYREALHTSFIFFENVEQYIVGHPCVILDVDAYTLALKAARALFDLYQRIGHLEAYVSDTADGTKT